MYFTSVLRHSPEHRKILSNYKIKESFRDAIERVHTRVMLTPGYLPDLCTEEIVQIRRGLTYFMEPSCLIPGQPQLFNPALRVDYSEKIAAAPSLYALKDKLERHLCSRTDSLFNLTNRVMLFDLTNFYFEGSKSGSEKARFGRSKEKRSDCRLLVLALAINTEGFIRYSSILVGNTADPDSLPGMVDGIIAKNPVSSHPDQKVLVVVDARIATEANL